MRAAVLCTMGEGIEEQLGEAMRRGYVAAYRWLRHPDQASDACQEAAARVLAHRGRFDSERPLYPWFYRILKNHCFDRLKAKKRFVGAEVEIADPKGTVEAEAVVVERQLAVRRGIEALEPPLREIIELRHFQEASYEEIAMILDIPAGTVMSRLYRARRALRAVLLSDPDGSGAALAGPRPHGDQA